MIVNKMEHIERNIDMNAVINSTIENTRGRFFTVLVLKKDGTVRAINGRVGVKKHLRGGVVPNGHVATLKDMLVVYDVKEKGYRAINKHNVLAVRVNKVEMVVC